MAMDKFCSEVFLGLFATSIKRSYFQQAGWLAVLMADPGTASTWIYCTDCIRWSGTWLIMRQLYSHSQYTVYVHTQQKYRHEH